MQNDIIDFVDIKLQSAEQTRLKVKDSFNYCYSCLCKCDSMSELSIRHEMILDMIHSAFVFGLIAYCTKVFLIEKVNSVYMLRSNEFKKIFLEEN